MLFLRPRSSFAPGRRSGGTPIRPGERATPSRWPRHRQADAASSWPFVPPFHGADPNRRSCRSRLTFSIIPRRHCRRVSDKAAATSAVGIVVNAAGYRDHFGHFLSTALARSAQRTANIPNTVYDYHISFQCTNYFKLITAPRNDLMSRTGVEAHAMHPFCLRLGDREGRRDRCRCFSRERRFWQTSPPSPFS